MEPQSDGAVTSVSSTGNAGLVTAQALGALGLPASGDAGEVAASDAETLAAFVGWASAIFYYCEVGENPGVNDYWDAFHYVATSLSVGYANIFPCTPAGKVIGAVVMMVGPALSARALNPPVSTPEVAPPSSSAAMEAALPELMSKLDAILVELRQLNAR